VRFERFDLDFSHGSVRLVELSVQLVKARDQFRHTFRESGTVKEQQAAGDRYLPYDMPNRGNAII
jgi:hypothetical protein